MHQKGFAQFLLIIIIVILAATSFYFIFGSKLFFKTNKAFKSVSCPITEPKYLDNSSYKGPLIDTHIHIPHVQESPIDGLVNNSNSSPILGGNITIDDYICMMDTEGTKSVFAFFSVWDPIRQKSLDVVKETMKRYPGRFVPFIMPPDRDDKPNGFPTVTSAVLEDMLNVYPGLFAGFGEIGLYARGDHNGSKGAPELPPDSDRFKDIYPVVRKHKLLVYFHLGEGQRESFEKALSENPDINFIWHGDQLISGNEDGTQDLTNIEQILSNHPNAYYGVDELYGNTWLIRPEVTKEEFLDHFKNYEPLLEKDLATWKGFIERHPNQVLWGTDRGWSTVWSLDPQVALTLNNYTRAFIGRLNPSAQENFAYKNAERLQKNVSR